MWVLVVSAHHCNVLCTVGEDYTFLGSSTRNVDVVIPTGVMSHGVLFGVVDDGILEPAETFEMNIVITSTSKDLLLGVNSATTVTLQDKVGFGKRFVIKITKVWMTTISGMIVKYFNGIVSNFKIIYIIMSLLIDRIFMC